MVYGLSLVSTSVEHVLQKRGTVSLVFMFCASCGLLSLCCFVIRAQIEKCSQVALVSAEPVEELSFCQPIRISAALFASFIVILCDVVLLSWCIAPSPLGKPCREQVLCPRTLNRESVSLSHFEECRILCLVHPRTLRSTKLV